MMLKEGNFGVWIITYNRPVELRRNIESLCASMPFWVSINVVSNHSQIVDLSEYRGVTVHMNPMRPDESGGYLSRSWNQCYYMGLSQVENILVTQDDVVFEPGWFERVCETPYQFYSAPFGGIAHVASRTSFLNVGWWDERFVGIDLEDYDYLARVFQRFHDSSSVLEVGASERTWNDVGLDAFWKGKGFVGDGSDRPRGEEKAHHRMNRAWFARKRGIDVAGNVRCHKDPAWRDYRREFVVDEIDWYPWFTAKAQRLTNSRQSFAKVPFSDYYGHDGYDV